MSGRDLQTSALHGASHPLGARRAGRQHLGAQVPLFGEFSGVVCACIEHFVRVASRHTTVCARVYVRVCWQAACVCTHLSHADGEHSPHYTAKLIHSDLEYCTTPGFPTIPTTGQQSGHGREPSMD